jgi:hypothetical protein
MADFAQTVSNSISTVGADPRNEWGEYNWNEFNWGSGDPLKDIITSTGKLIAESQGTSMSYIEDINHLLDGETLTLAVSVFKSFSITISAGGVSIAGDCSSQTVESGGWNRKFIGGVTNAEDRPTFNWAEDSAPSSNWSETTKPSDGWS